MNIFHIHQHASSSHQPLLTPGAAGTMYEDPDTFRQFNRMASATAHSYFGSALYPHAVMPAPDPMHALMPHQPQYQYQHGHSRMLSAVSSVPFNGLTNPRQDPNISMTLDNSDLWTKFHKLGTEMIITKNGRRMFPPIRVKCTGLNEKKNYYMLIDCVPLDDSRYKYHNSEWVVTGKAEPHMGGRFFTHPDSPASGSHWMKQPVSFNKMKLTNNNLDQNGHLVLNSMHKYVPRVYLLPTDGVLVHWNDCSIFTFTETSFIAVTAYQNENITQLKIDWNPFAKGFRNEDNKKKAPKRENDGNDANCRETKRSILDGVSNGHGSSSSSSAIAGQDGVRHRTSSRQPHAHAHPHGLSHTQPHRARETPPRDDPHNSSSESVHHAVNGLQQSQTHNRSSVDHAGSSLGVSNPTTPAPTTPPNTCVYENVTPSYQAPDCAVGGAAVVNGGAVSDPSSYYSHQARLNSSFLAVSSASSMAPGSSLIGSAMTPALQYSHTAGLQPAAINPALSAAYSTSGTAQMGHHSFYSRQPPSHSAYDALSPANNFFNLNFNSNGR